METFTSKEFFEQLNTNTIKQSLGIKGIVKRSGKDSELLFKRKGESSNWIAIPSSMVESVKVIKTFAKENETFVVVKLQLKTPTTPEGKVLFELLSSVEKSCSENKLKGGKFSKEGYGGHTCGCGCHHQPNCGCECNHGYTCGCGCHHQSNCGCQYQHEHHGECGDNSKCNCKR